MNRCSAMERSSFRQKRLLIVHSSDELYGSDRVLLDVVEAVRMNRLVDVEVWLPSDTAGGPQALTEKLVEMGVRTRHAPLPILRRALLNPSGLLTLARRTFQSWRQLRREDFDAIYCMTSACLILAPIARLAGAGRIVLHVQEQWSGFEGKALGMLARSVDCTIANSTATRDATGPLGAGITVVPNGVPDPPRAETPKFPITPGLRFVVASRWGAGKGHETLLRAWNMAGCQGHLTVLGGPPSNGAVVDVHAMVHALVDDPRSVEVVGEVADITAAISRSDALLLPSDGTEGFGLVIVEAAAQGKPAIASRSGGPETVITDGHDGWLFDRKDVAGLARLLKILDLATVQKAGRFARSNYERNYTQEIFRQRIGEILMTELSEQGSQRHDLEEKVSQ